MAAIGLVGGAGMAFEPPLPAAVRSKGERKMNRMPFFSLFPCWEIGPFPHLYTLMVRVKTDIRFKKLGESNKQARD